MFGMHLFGVIDLHDKPKLIMMSEELWLHQAKVKIKNDAIEVISNDFKLFILNYRPFKKTPFTLGSVLKFENKGRINKKAKG